MNTSPLQTTARRQGARRPFPKPRFTLCIVHCALCIVLARGQQFDNGNSANRLCSTRTNEEIHESIERGLRFLQRGQQADGNFNSDLSRRVPGIAALAGMAYLATGHVPGEGEFGDVINKCIDAVLNRADRNKYLGGHDGRMYSHAICTLFLSEVSGIVDPERQKRIDDVLPRATKIIIDAQAVPKDVNHKGGWRYNPNSTDSDLSCSGWNLMALRSMRLNGAPVPDLAISEAVRYTLNRHNSQTGQFGYQGNTDYSVTLTGAAILSLALCGAYDNPAIPRGVRYLNSVFRQLPSQDRCFYGMYYTSQGLFQWGGPEWQAFADWMYEYWIPRQTPEGGWNRGEENCPYYQTAMVINAFTVPYRQLPIYQRDETVDPE